MKKALLVYNKNLSSIYPAKWIEEFKHSIDNQTDKDFEILEINYGSGPERIFGNSQFELRAYPSFVYALNYLLDVCNVAGYDCVFNTNVDDTYALDRIEKQAKLIEEGYDIVSSNFSLVEDDVITHTHKFENLNLPLELSNNHNPICHPVVAYSKNFLRNNRYVPEQQPLEDMMLWQRTVKKYKFVILPDVLCYHRLHSNSVCENEENR